jgi:hypothetical protein
MLPLHHWQKRTHESSITLLAASIDQVRTTNWSSEELRKFRVLDSKIAICMPSSKSPRN